MSVMESEDETLRHVVRAGALDASVPCNLVGRLRVLLLWNVLVVCLW